tara:strand:+ start:274 stop:2670 length:2397 start_codon:yes stop_codon:yes gene_type:complete
MKRRLMLFAVVSMVAVGLFAGISFGTYANSVHNLYDNIYADEDDGVNLADIWVENTASTWDGEIADSLCSEIAQNWPDPDLPLVYCEPRVVLDGLMFHSEEGDEKLVPAVWHGIDEGWIDKVWMPDHDCCSGRLAAADDEIVLDEHAASGMGIVVGDVVSIGAGHGSMNFTVVGIGYHPYHLYYAVEGSILPADPGTFVTGYLSDSGIERLGNLSAGSANLLLLDAEGTPEFDLQSTVEVEGESLSQAIVYVRQTVMDNDDSSFITYDRSGVTSVEFLRADAEGASMSYPIITGMIAMVAGITIFLSLQRLIQSQAREIAILRTLGVPKSAIMPGFILAPIAIGIFGSSIGIILGAVFGGPAMVTMYEDIIGIPAIGFSTEPSLILQNLGISMAVVLIAGIKPAYEASTIQPLDILRGQNEVRISSRGIQRLTSRLPTTVGLTVRSSVRKPMRLVFTFFAVGLSMLIFGTMSMMMDSMEDLVSGADQNWDAQVNVPFGGEAAVIEWAEGNDADYEAMLVFPGNAEGDTRQFLAYGLDVISTADDAMIPIELVEGKLPALGAGTPEVIVDEGTMLFLEWEIGQTQTVMFGPFSLEVKITGVTRGEVSRTVYFHRSDLSDAIGLQATSILLSLPDGVELDDQVGEMSVGITQRQDMIDSFDSLLEKQQGIYNAILGLGILIAVAVLSITLLMNLSERDSELATLRVLGAPMSIIRKMMLGEHFAIGLIGGILSAAFTIIMAQYLISQLVQWAFYFTLQPNFASTLQLILVVVVISVLSTPIGTWRVSKMDLVEKVKDLSQ